MTSAHGWASIGCLLLPIWLLLTRFILMLLPKPKHHRRKRYLKNSKSQSRSHRQKPEWVKCEVVKLKARLPNAGCRHITYVFNRLHAKRNTTISKSYAAYVIRNSRYEIEQARKQFQKRKPKPLAKNIIWGLDLTGKADTSGAMHQIIGIIDHGSRLALRLKRISNKSSLTLLGHFLIAMGEYGKPKSIRTDNEAVFTSRTFNAALSALGVRHQTTELHAPWQNGRIERLFGTLKQVLNKFTVRSASELQEMLGSFTVWYNAIRPHQSLNGQTPLEAWKGIDAYSTPSQCIYWFEAIDSEVAGYYIRR